MDRPASTVRRNLTHLPGVIGVDEAGRGPLAGPVVVAAVVLPKGFRIKGIDDSKKLLPETRERLAAYIKENAAAYQVVIGDLESIERLNILHATLAAMAEAVSLLGFEGDRILIDGDKVPPPLRGKAEAVVEGDGKFACIAAASILAKTERDRMMKEMAPLYPEYGFERHFGYATPEHLEAIRQYGPCPIHRMTFSPFAEMRNQPCLTFEA
jgi:ribonuclease HII